MRGLSFTEIQQVNGSGLLGGGFILRPMIAGLSTVILTPTVDTWLPVLQKKAANLIGQYEPSLIKDTQLPVPQSLQQFLTPSAQRFWIGAVSYLIASII